MSLADHSMSKENKAEIEGSYSSLIRRGKQPMQKMKLTKSKKSQSRNGSAIKELPNT